METTWLIKEEMSDTTYTKHDQLYKELIKTFFEEFLAAFFPEVHEYLDVKIVTPLSEEVYTDVLEGKTRRLDLVMEAKVKGTDALVIVHIEPQSYVDRQFHERMFRYFSLLYNEYRKPIIPITVFSYESDWEEYEYKMEFPFFRVLTFNYLTLHLKKQNWRKYIRSNNPAAAALMSRMNYTEEERVQVKKEFLRMIVRMKLDPARERLIYGFFETYLKLNEKEEEMLMREIEKLPEADEIFEIPISYEEKGKEIGKEIGKELGKKEVAKELLREGLSLEFIAKVTKLDEEEIKELKKEM